MKNKIQNLLISSSPRGESRARGASGARNGRALPSTDQHRHSLRLHQAPTGAGGEGADCSVRSPRPTSFVRVGMSAMAVSWGRV